MKVLVTGASGFVGSALCRHLEGKGQSVVAAVRNRSAGFSPEVEQRIVSDLGADVKWGEVLVGINAVVHCSARVHVMNETSIDPLEAFREINLRGTTCLAEQAVKNGVKRFVFISSIKVNGESTRECPFSAESIPAPEDPYGISKWETEQALQKLAKETGLEVVIIRPPLVYGPGVRANFLKLMQMVNLGFPLPLGAINNQRSLVALDNLVDLIDTCLSQSAAINQTFLVSDGHDLSTTELIKNMAVALGKPARLISVSESVLWIAAKLFGKRDFAQRLCGSLQVDIDQTRSRLGWSPPVSVEDAFRKTAEHFLSE